MNKNIIIGALLVVIVVLIGYIIWETQHRSVAQAPSDQLELNTTVR